MDGMLGGGGGGGGQARAAEPAWSTILSESVTDPEVLELASLNIFADIPFFLLGRLIYLFALDRLHLKMRGLENLPAKGPFLLCSNHQSYVDPLVMAGLFPLRPFSVTLPPAPPEHFGQ